MSDRRVAAFDFDGTLTRRDTLVPFLVHACGRRSVGAALRKVAPVVARARIRSRSGGDHHRDVVKEHLLSSLLAGRDAAWFRGQGEEFSSTLERRLRPEMTGQVAWHRAEGHELVIVSASLSTYLAPFARDHGFDHVIAVEMEVDESGRLTGRLASPNVRGAEKARRLTRWLDGEPPEFLWGYGNSAGDRELLEMADVPVWVTRP